MTPIRVLYYPDRIIVQNIRSFVKDIQLSDINAIIDATNKLTTCAGQETETSFLVLPFDGQPTETNKEPLGRPLGVEAAIGFLGVLQLFSGPFAIFALQVKRVGELPGGIPIYAITKVRFAKLFVGADTKADRELGLSQTKLLESGHVFFSVESDLTRRLQKQYSSSSSFASSNASFWWNYHLCEYLDNSYRNSWCLKTIYGFVETTELQFICHEHTNNALEDWKGNQSEPFMMTLISRRSRKRAGLRYITRGIDRRGDVANFVETEQIIWKSSLERRKNCSFSSYVIIRGSVPVFWRQNKGSVKPPPELDAPLDLCRSSFRKHFQNLIRSYGSLVALSLVDQHGSEAILASTYARHFELDMDELCSQLSDTASSFYRPQLVSFDFHFHCSGTDWERGMQTLLHQVKSYASRQKFFVLHSQDESIVRSMQDGVFRVNCVDCLDRTNVAQSAIARHLLVPQAKSVYVAGLHHWNRTKLNNNNNNTMVGPSRLETTSESQFSKIWSNNADTLSKQYAGTGALKTDYTRSGKRSTKGLFKDGVNSVMRMYYKNFVDEERQDAMDLWLGVAVANSIFSRTLLWSRYNNVQRLSPGGDKQYVMVELREQGMLVTSPEGIHYEYPRKSFLQWSKRLSTSGKARLRLWFDESLYPQSLPITNPLDLHFHKGGPAARERFLRALVSWSDLSIPGYGQRIRVRVFSTCNEAPLSFSDWGISNYEESKSTNQSHSNDIEILCLTVPFPGPNSRKYGLAAVPLDMDTFGYHLISAIAADRKFGPAMAVFVKGNVSKGLIMEVNEHAYRSSIMSSVSSHSDIFNNSTGMDIQSHNGGVAISLEVSGVLLCFVGVHVQGPRELFDVLTHLRVGRPDFDITNQFPYFYLSGTVHGDLHWSRKNARGDPIWAKMADGSQVMALSNGISLMRNSFPGWEYLENLDFYQRTPFHGGANSSSSQLIQPLIDEYIPGRPLPQLTKEIFVCDIWISHLAASNLRLPPGTDPGIPLSFYLTFENDWVEDGVTTKVVQRGNQPYWSEVVLVRMLLTQDVADLCDQYLLGRVMIETPFVEDIAAGYFILPLYPSGNFDIPIRLGGVYAGHLSGQLQKTRESLLDEQSVSQEMVGGGGGGKSSDYSQSNPTPSYSSPHIKRTNKKKVRKWVGKVTNMFRNRHKSGSDAFDIPKDDLTYNEERRTTTLNEDDSETHKMGISEQDDQNRALELSSSTTSSDEGEEPQIISADHQNWFDSSSLIDLDYEPTTSNTRTDTTPLTTTFDDLLISEPLDGHHSKESNKPSEEDESLLSCLEEIDERYRILLSHHVRQIVYPIVSLKRSLVTETSAGLKRTALYDIHLKYGAKMTEFCGYEMPLQYNDGIRDNHLFVRNSAGLFDVSHMGQVRIYGRHRASFLERLVVADITSLPPYHAVLSLLTSERGGILDDTIVTNMGDHINMVINACCRSKDMAHLQHHAEQARSKGEEVIIELQEQRGLVALQGPNAMKVLSKHVNDDLSSLYFMNARTMLVDNVECLVSRCGYTGEDGFEISVPNDSIPTIFDNLCDSSMVRPSGLAARDSLRLEAGLCLYGNDMDESTSPVEASLGWTIPKSRREHGGFLGDQVILKQLKEGVARRRVGFVLKGAPARGHEKIFEESGRVIGQVTSGVFSPCLGKPIGMGYVEKNFAKSGTPIQVEIRQKKVEGELVKMPFVPSHYYKP